MVSTEPKLPGDSCGISCVMEPSRGDSIVWLLCSTGTEVCVNVASCCAKLMGDSCGSCVVETSNDGELTVA